MSEEIKPTETTSTTSSETVNSQATPSIQADQSQTSSKEPVATIAEGIAKPEEKKEEAPVADEGYDLELPENSILSQEDLDAIAEYASINGLSKEAAEKLIAIKENSYKGGMDKVQAEISAKHKADFEAIQKDPIFIGEQKAKTYESMNRAIQTFGSPELVEILKTPEVGNNIVIARFLKAIGDAMAQDTIQGKPAVASTEDKGNQTLQKLYPEFFDKK
jgi:hypothetical protein